MQTRLNLNVKEWTIPIKVVLLKVHKIYVLSLRETIKIGTLKRTCVYCDLGLSKIEMNLDMQKTLNDLFLE